jgi:uncharacterized protein YndB with AHSA1/START domain
MKEYTTAVVIDASPDVVWGVLTDAGEYAHWNPEIPGITGAIRRGGRITVRVRLGSGAVRTMAMRVVALDSPRRMVWLGGLPFGLFVGRRTFLVDPHDGGAQFRMHLEMSGPLSGPIVRSIGDRQPEIDRFSQALKAQAERLMNR